MPSPSTEIFRALRKRNSLKDKKRADPNDPPRARRSAESVIHSLSRTFGIKSKRRSQPSWDAPMAVSEPLSLPAAPYSLSTCGVNSRSTPTLTLSRDRGKDAVPSHHSDKLTEPDTAITRPPIFNTVDYEGLPSSTDQNRTSTKTTDPLRHSTTTKSTLCASHLLHESDIDTEQNTALWLSRHKKKASEERATSGKSYESIYDQVVASREEQGPGTVAQSEKHTRSASDPLARSEPFALRGRSAEKPPQVDSLWSASSTQPHSILHQEHSDSSTYIDSVGSEMKWRDSYSDLSAFSARSSNQSSGFESGQSTVADTGRLSPQSSLDGSVLMGNYGERVVSRLPIPTREGVAHSAKIPSAERHDCDSVLFFGQSRCSRGATVSSCTDNEKSMFQRQQRRSSLVDEAVTELEDSVGLSAGRPLDPLKKTKLPEPELKQIQKQAVLSYLRQRQANEGIGMRLAQFRDKPPETAEKPTPFKPMAVKLLEDNDLPPELPPKMYKSSELLHGIGQQMKEVQRHTSILPHNEQLDASEAQKPPRPPPKTFKLSAQKQTAMLKALVTPPPIREKPEKLRHRRTNDASLVAAKMIFIPPTPCTGQENGEGCLKPCGREPTPPVASSADDNICRTAGGEDTAVPVPPALLHDLPEMHSSSLKTTTSVATSVEKDQTRRLFMTSASTKSDETPQRSRFDDGYGTSLDDEDDTSLSASTVVAKAKTTSADCRVTPDIDSEVTHATRLAALSRLAQEEATVREEIAANDAIGTELRRRLEELNREREVRKLTNYISEVDEIAALVVALILRINRTKLALQSLAAEGLADQKAQLVQKLEKTEQELEEARRLETNCGKRWVSFGAHLATFLEPEELIGRYLHFMKNRADLLVKQRTIQDRQQMRKP